MFSNSPSSCEEKTVFSMKRVKMEIFSSLLRPVPKDGGERQTQKREDTSRRAYPLCVYEKKLCLKRLI